VADDSIRLNVKAIDDADPDARQIAALLDRIPGAWDRIEARDRWARVRWGEPTRLLFARPEG
jgi:hypothetical protein